MKILYINVIEQNADWGAETFLNKGIESLGHVTTNLDYRKHRRSLAIKLNKISDFDVLFLQRGDRFPPHLLKICNRPKFFWATELVSRNRDQDILLKSNQFDHIFVHSNDCKKRVINNNWVDEKNISVMLNGFDEELHKRITADKDIDIEKAIAMIVKSGYEGKTVFTNRTGEKIETRKIESKKDEK